MGAGEIKQQVQKKRFLIDAFLYSASLPSGAGRDQVLRHSVTRYYLQAVVLELVIKMFYELDLRKPAPFTHNLVNLFNELNKETKDFGVAKFDEARNRRRKQFEQIKDVEFHPLQDVLANNEMIVKNFKYDVIGVPSNSSVDGTFYDEVFKYIDRKISDLNV